MDFFLSPSGLIYNLPALGLLAFLLWARPLEGALVAALAGVRVLGPHLGVGQWIPFSVHMTLAVVAATAYRPGRISSTWILFAGAVVVALMTTHFYVSIWDRPTVYWQGTLAGLVLRGAFGLLQLGWRLFKRG